MRLFTSAVDALNRAEQELFSSSLSWWRSWQARHSLGKPAQPTTIKRHDVHTGAKQHVHTVSATAAGADANATPLVCLHGFAHGTSVFAPSIGPLAEQWSGPVHVLDSPGCGLSSRPSLKHDSDQEKRRLAAEDFFCQGLEAWREAMCIERMVLAGHSIGGYCAVAYAERHPERVERLILISPAGVPRGPSPEDMKDRMANASVFFRVAFSLWDKGYSPLSLVKTGAGWGPGKWLVDQYVYRRVGPHSWVDQAQYADYMYRNHVAGDGSWGGTAHATLLRPGAYAHAPLCDRFGALDYARGPKRVAFVYGTRDWMDPTAAEAVRDGASGALKGRLEVCRVSGAGHNVQLDNPLGFVEAVVASGRAGALDGRTFGADAMRKEAVWQAEAEHGDVKERA